MERDYLITIKPPPSISKWWKTLKISTFLAILISLVPLMGIVSSARKWLHHLMWIFYHSSVIKMKMCISIKHNCNFLSVLYGMSDFCHLNFELSPCSDIKGGSFTVYVLFQPFDNSLIGPVEEEVDQYTSIFTLYALSLTLLCFYFKPHMLCLCSHFNLSNYKCFFILLSKLCHHMWIPLSPWNKRWKK